MAVGIAVREVGTFKEVGQELEHTHCSYLDLEWFDGP